MTSEDSIKPVISLLSGGGYRIALGPLSGQGATLQAAMTDLSLAISSQYDSEKGNETAAAETAARQTDILANDRFIRGGQLQQSVLMAMALGFI